MRKGLQSRKAAIAFMLAAMMAVPSISGAKALAADDYDHEIDVYATDENKEVEVGNITSDDEGIEVYVSDGYNATVTAGNITAEYDGVYIRESDSDNSVVNISTGNIKSGDDGICVDDINGDNSVVSISTGDITADGYGINVEDYIEEDSALNISTGSITGADDYGIYVENNGNGPVEMKVNGSVSCTDDGGEAVYLYTDGGKLSLVVNGDIISPGIGLSLDTDSEDGTADVFVEGTIDGGEVGVSLYGDHDFEAENLSLTVWRIKPNADDEIVDVYKDTYPDMKEEFDEKIMYIIKVEQPTEGGTIAVTDKDGNALNKSHDYDVANQGDKVLLKVDSEGYKITGAYNGVDGKKVKLLKDANGNYYVVVPKGGGVYLTAVLEKEKFDISFYDDDGNLIQTNTVDYGDTITIPDAPTREGYELLYWEGSKYYPGDQYTVTGPHTFKAVWKKIEEKATEDTEETEKPDDTAAGTTDNTSKPVASSPATDDATNIVMLFILMMLSASGAVIAANLKKRLNRKED